VLLESTGGFTRYTGTRRSRRSPAQDEVPGLAEVLNQRDQPLHSVLQSATDAVVIVNKSLRILFWNRVAESVFGYSVEEAIGLPLISLVPERYRQSHQEGIARVLSGRERPMLSRTIQVFAIRQDGTEFPAEVSISSWTAGDDVFVVGFIRDTTERMLHENELNRMHQELERRVEERNSALLASNRALRQSREELRALATRLVSVREEENKRMSREIHDQLGQELTAAKLTLAHLTQAIPGEESEQHRHALNLTLLLDSVLQEVRTIARDLRPSVLDHFGLLAAIDSLAEDFERRTGISCLTDFRISEPRLDDLCSTSIYRIVQEALTNVARHAAATQVIVRLEMDGTRIQLEVIDNGKGIANSDPQVKHGLGLLGMRERALQFGGELRISRLRTKGTRVALLIPLSSSEV
jgi:two-component system, NarL family, sensor histidine kinase UhpB